MFSGQMFSLACSTILLASHQAQGPRRYSVCCAKLVLLQPLIHETKYSHYLAYFQTKNGIYTKGWSIIPSVWITFMYELPFLSFRKVSLSACCLPSSLRYSLWSQVHWTTCLHGYLTGRALLMSSH